MPLKQLYYTSCKHPVTGTTGFQVKAASPGISQQTMDVLNNLMGYKIPSRLANQPIEEHPAALRYYYINTQEAILLCSQSNGTDEFSRPGNYFVHALIGEPDIINELPPVMYWGSPLWVDRDDSPTVELPTLSKISDEAKFDYNAAWAFIKSTERRQWFHRLLCAIIDGRRKIVIVDDIDNIAIWVYAASLAFPKRFQAFLSFSTYHHDPRTAPFTIIGQPIDPDYSFSNEFFVLNARSGDVSEAPPSSYADYVNRHFEETAYEEELLEFFTWTEPRARRTRQISRVLDHLADFYLARTKGSALRDWDRVVTASSAIVEDVIRHADDLQLRDVEDLQGAVELLGDALEKDTSVLDAYRHALTTLQRHDSSFPDTCADAIRRLCFFINNDSPEVSSQLQTLLENLYTPQLIEKTVNEPGLMAEMAAALPTDRLEPVTQFWQIVGRYFNFGAASAAGIPPFFKASFAALDAQSVENALRVPPAALTLLGVLVKTVGEHRDLLLRSATEYKHDHPDSWVFEWLYYLLVERLPAAQRVDPYWKVYWNQFPDLYRYELRRELMKRTDTESVLALVATWVQLWSDPDVQRAITSEALDAAWERLDQVQIARGLLRDLGTALDPVWYNRLVERLLQDAVIESPDDQTAALYERFESDPELQLDPLYRAVIQGALILHGKPLTEEAIANIQQRLSQIDTPTYERAASRLMSQLFLKQHLAMIRMTYVVHQNEAFWGVYWRLFHDLLLKEQRIGDTINVITFWFEAPSELVEHHPYVVPEFFMEILNVLREIRNNRSYKRIEHDFEGVLTHQPWYPAIQKAFQKSRKGLLGGFF